VPATLAATVTAALAAPTPQPWLTLATVLGLFGGTILVVVAVLRWTGGPGSLTRRRAVPVGLAAEAAALVVGWRIGLPAEVFAAFAAFFVAGLLMLAGERANVSAHCLTFGTLTGLLLGWFPAVGFAAVLLLAVLAAARLALRQHTLVQATIGALVGCALGLLAANLVA